MDELEDVDVPVDSSTERKEAYRKTPTNSTMLGDTEPSVQANYLIKAEGVFRTL